jgi:asparagine synthase (glutamine-hydrolysing)
MCGINGISWENNNDISEMNEAIVHRGPDGNGTYVDDGVSLGHVRLSILDPTIKANQPMVNEINSLVLVYNGELYNFKEIKEKLVKKGINFLTNSDTEVILYAYQEYGTAIFKELNGIFSFAILDKEKQQLILVRDRLGIKPLYYGFKGNDIIFSSELKGIKCSLELEFSENRTWDYLLSSNITGESFYSNVTPLTPGTFGTFDLNSKKLTTEKYCQLIDLIKEKKYNKQGQVAEEKIIDELDELLNTVVKDQMVSDVPIASVGSGGLDSSLVTAIAAQYNSDISVYHVKVDDDKCDESKYAKQVAKYLNLELKTEILSKSNYLEYVDYCIEVEELPLSHPNSVGIYLISKKAKEDGIKVLLTGEGADELFGGYHRYKAYQKKLMFNRLPILPKIIKKFSNLLIHPGFGGFSTEDVANYLEQAPGFAFNVERNRFITELKTAFSFIENEKDRELKTYISTDLQYYLPPILRRTDRMSMAAGLEMRVPFLDNRLLDFSLNLPVKHQINKYELKYLLKKVGERYLPRDIVYRSKKGFPLPINDWLGDHNFKSCMNDRWLKLNNEPNAKHQR